MSGKQRVMFKPPNKRGAGRAAPCILPPSPSGKGVRGMGRDNVIEKNNF